MKNRARASNLVIPFLCALALTLSTSVVTHAAKLVVGCNVTELVNAIHAANANPGPDALQLAMGCSYSLTTVDNTSDALGPNGLPTIASDISIYGKSTTIARSAAEGTPAFRLMQVNENGALQLFDVVLANGYSASTPASVGAGGAIYLNGGQVVIDRSTLSGNTANAFYTGGGGAVYNARGSLTIVNSSLSHNRAQGGGPRTVGGGAIWNDGALVIVDSRFEQNSALAGCSFQWCGGGALYHHNGAATITGALFVNNRAAVSGGAITNSGNLVISESTFGKNITGSGVAGAAGIANLGAAKVNQTSFDQNGGIGITNLGTLTVSQSGFSSNENSGLRNLNAARVMRSIFWGNVAVEGAGIYNAGVLKIKRTRFSANRSQTSGGGIYNQKQLSMNGGTFVANAAPTGAGIHNVGTVTVKHSQFIKNNAARGGGGISNLRGAARVIATFFDGNVANQRGGNLANLGDQNSTLTITTSTLLGGIARQGGGIYNAGKLELQNSTLVGNTAPSNAGRGGAVYNAGDASAANSTFYQNAAAQGGAFYNTQTLNLVNVTLAHDHAARGGALHAQAGLVLVTNTIFARGAPRNCQWARGAIVNRGHNLDSDGSCGVGPATDPRLDPKGLQNNGGPTQTIALPGTSPAIDAGDDFACAAPPVNHRDQRGILRPQGRHCDMGAFELER